MVNLHIVFIVCKIISSNITITFLSFNKPVYFEINKP